MAKLPRGTTQSLWIEETGLWVIEIWHGNGWHILYEAGNFKTKKLSDEYGFANYPAHKK